MCSPRLSTKRSRQSLQCERAASGGPPPTAGGLRLVGEESLSRIFASRARRVYDAAKVDARARGAGARIKSARRVRTRKQSPRSIHVRARTILPPCAALAAVCRLVAGRNSPRSTCICLECCRAASAIAAMSSVYCASLVIEPPARATRLSSRAARRRFAAASAQFLDTTGRGSRAHREPPLLSSSSVDSK